MQAVGVAPQSVTVLELHLEMQKRAVVLISMRKVRVIITFII